jgi:Hemerythrin HHE cation binding domain
MSGSKTSPQPASADPPRPMPFAIMRNAHEALRASIHLQAQRLDAGDSVGFREEWQTFKRALAVHMAMEDDSMFGLLDGVGAGAITAAKLPDEHVEDTRLAATVDAALGAADVSALRAVWSAWKEDHLHHLAHEEEIMMPLTMKTAATPEARTHRPRPTACAQRAPAELRLVYRLGGEYAEPTWFIGTASECCHPCFRVGITACVLTGPMASLAPHRRAQLHARDLGRARFQVWPER